MACIRSRTGAPFAALGGAPDRDLVRQANARYSDQRAFEAWRGEGDLWLASDPLRIGATPTGDVVRQVDLSEHTAEPDARANDPAWHVGCGAAFGAKQGRGSSVTLGKIMWPFSIFTRRRPKPAPSSRDPISAEAFLASFDTTDYLGDAARLGQEADEAIKEKRYDVAWRLLHEQKERYGKHAARYGMTARQTIALDASVHESLANIRRLEGNHDDALVHLLYCVWSSGRPSKAQEKKIETYFRRCGFDGVTSDDLRRFRQSGPDFRTIRNKVAEWKAKK